MLWEAYQQTRIAGTERTAADAKSKVDRFGKSVEDLRKHVERLSLACQAMWELLRDYSELTEEDIESKMLEIDGRDGNQDGKIGIQQLNCLECGRKTNSKRSTCVICGAPIKRPHRFEG